MQKIDDIGKYFGPIVEWRLVNRRTLLNKQGDKMTATGEEPVSADLRVNRISAT